MLLLFLSQNDRFDEYPRFLDWSLIDLVYLYGQINKKTPK